MSDPILHHSITGRIIKAFYNVYNTLGYGFLEKVYEKAMILELCKLGLKSRPQQPITVYYDDVSVGDYYADTLVDDKFIVELKAEAAIHPKHEAQLINYLKATNIEGGILFNFGEKAVFKRKIFLNRLK